MPCLVLLLPTVVTTNAFEGLEHDDRVATDYHHADPHLLAAFLLLDRLVQHDIQEDIVSTKNADNLATAVELHKQPLVEVLHLD